MNIHQTKCIFCPKKSRYLLLNIHGIQCMNFIKEHKKFIKVNTLKKNLKKEIFDTIILSMLIGKLDIKVQNFFQKLVVNGNN